MKRLHVHVSVRDGSNLYHWLNVLSGAGFVINSGGTALTRRHSSGVYHEKLRT
jgi:hypothetical protein